MGPIRPDGPAGLDGISRAPSWTDEVAETIATISAEIDLELSGYTSPDERAGVEAVFEATGAMITGPAAFDY